MAGGPAPASGGGSSFLDQLKSAKASTGPCTVDEAKSRGVWGRPNSDYSSNSQGQTNINASSPPRKYDYDKSKPSLQDMRKDWGPDYEDSPGYGHDYVVPDTDSTAKICDHAVLACTIKNVHTATVATNVPGNDDASDGAIRPAKMFDISAGNVVVVDEGSSVTNVTLKGHLLYYGYIKRTIIDKPDGIYLSVHGHGVNRSWLLARSNEEVGRRLFQHQNLETRGEFESRFGFSGIDPGGYDNGPWTNSP